METTIPIQTPKIIFDQYLNYPIQDMRSSTELSSTNSISYDLKNSEHQTIESLNKFLQQQCWRSAVNWTTTYLLKHSHDYHIWFIRFACLIKLRLFQTVENEFQTFGNLDCYSKFPFSLRLLHAELPIYIDSNHFHDGLDRLFRLLMITNTILSILPKDQSQLWHKRRLRILYSVANCYTLMKRIDLMISIIENQIINLGLGKKKPVRIASDR